MQTKAEHYKEVLAQAASLTESEHDEVANMANLSALLYEEFGWWWVGFYRVVEGELVLGPFQGPIACTRIKKGRGVCGTSWERGETIVVPDVEQFPGHIACSAASRSEIVVPVQNKSGEIIAVLDIDSAELNTFDLIDKSNLEQLVKLLA